MQFNKNLLLIICAAMIMISCKRTTIYGDIEPNTDRMMVEFATAQDENLLAMEFSTGIKTIDLTELRIMPRSNVTKDATVKILVNPTIVADYNTAHGTNYTPLPSNLYELENSQFTLTRTERSKWVRLKVDPSTLLADDYAIGLSISESNGAEISPVSQNIFIALSVKNKYDGVYKLKGYATIPNTPYIGNFKTECADDIWLVTSGANSVYIDAQVFNDGAGGITAFSNILPNFVFDLATDKVTNVTARTGSLAMVFPQNPAYDSRFDPATRTLYIRYGISSLASGRYVIDTLEYCGPR